MTYGNCFLLACTRNNVLSIVFLVYSVFLLMMLFGGTLGLHYMLIIPFIVSKIWRIYRKVFEVWIEILCTLFPFPGF